jgi:hypothetical protein
MGYPRKPGRKFLSTHERVRAFFLPNGGFLFTTAIYAVVRPAVETPKALPFFSTPLIIFQTVPPSAVRKAKIWCQCGAGRELPDMTKKSVRHAAFPRQS